MKTIVIKPHHLIDVLKLHGAGIDKFVPDVAYQHDFHTIANYVVNGKVKDIIFTIGEDDICRPCIHNKDHHCGDIVYNKSKEEHNIAIDNSLIKLLSLPVNVKISSDEVWVIFKDKLTLPVYREAWPHVSEGDIEARFKYGLIGLGKVISTYSK